VVRYNLAPSRLARYYFFECDRFLRYDATPRDRRADEGVPPRHFDTSPVTRAILAGGEAWEQHVLTEYLPHAITGPSTDDSADVTKRTLPYGRTLEALRTSTPGTAIYQPTLRAPRSMFDAYGLDPDLVTFSDSRPDLLMIVDGDDGPEVRVVDLKASDVMKLSHRIQVGIYTLLLRHMLGAEGVDHLGSARTGGVWLYQSSEPEWFPLSSIVPPIEAFLERELTELLTTPAGDVFWHLYYRCEWCDFYEHCRSEAEQTDDVSLVPYLSSFGKRHLRTAAGVRTVADFANVLDRDDADEVLRGSASLEGRATHFQRGITALQTGQPQLTGGASVAMPVWENVRLVITVQEDPLTGELFGYAINRALGKPVFGTGAATLVHVASDGSTGTLAQLRRSLVADLIAILRAVDTYNADREWREQQSLQAYVFDTYERELLVGALLQVIEESDDLAVIEDALALLFHFRHPDLAQADDQPEKEVLFPLVVLTDVLRSVYALPIPVSYRFADVNRTLQPERYGFTYHPNDWFDFRLSNRMRADAILRAWTQRDPGVLDDIHKRLRWRVWGANSVVNGLRDRLRSTGVLFAWPPKFRLPESFGFSDPLLSRLAFIAQYERVLRYLDVRGRRMRPVAEGLASGDTYELIAEGDDWFRLHRRHADPALTAGSFASHILTTVSDAGREARLTYDEFRGPWPSKRRAAAITTITEIREHDDGTQLRLRLAHRDAFTPPSAGDVCYLDGLFTDWTTDRVVAALRSHDSPVGSWFTRLLRDPVATSRPVEVSPSVRASAIEIATEHGMTMSQRAAFRGVVDRDLQVVWGPPGTGKTHFVGLAMLALAEAHRRAGLPLRVLVTAQTHTAIDNCLAKLLDLQADGGVYGAALPVRKLSQSGGGAESLAPTDAPAWAAEHDICVVGSTVWQVRKVPPEDLAYDLIVVDEGSQVKVGEAAIPLLRLANGGRVVIAGDDRQLPPIVAGAYPEVDDEPLLHRSVLEAIRHRDPDDVLMAPLLENWRMCDDLCAYPAASIYPAGYAPATASIAARRLPPAFEPEADLVAAVLDPAYPLVVCVLEDVQATAENRVEADLVADVALALRQRYRDADDTDDAAYWRDHLFVVSPHHVQIRAIRRALRAARHWGATPFVDTVDRMQGQECDAVIVSYGVSDVEYALGERDFIYSLNRLNVAITRARMKSIVFLPRPLLDPPIQALDSDRVADGIAFMQGLANWCGDASAPMSFELPSGSLTVLRAGTVPK
jgi:DNA replication ATP-dependent helicase Dna2